ncbi:hypothetical protein QRD02_14190 [Aequorivita sp. SDUM287046]|uniref:Restriction endonuclease n=1 Tax=Aequorivita aurantiaca TaxID=3053356 RepID=A0ABT8DJH5_9FLAO|nr:hypothetical protein [Aequorivita aurantiaca]MDN3725531.1 hypothetical protein [Aequorivita aurantiaca]
MGGFTYENNKNNPKIFKNSEEFALCSLFVKEFKIALLPILKHLNNGKLHQRLMQLFSKIKALDRTSEKGSCNVGEGLKSQKGKLLLREFIFTPKAGIRQKFGNPIIDVKNFCLLWKDFDSSSAKFPKGATDFELLYLVLAYEPALNLFTTYEAAPIRRSKTEKAEQLELKLQEKISKKDGNHYIPIVGLRFLEILGEEEYECLGQDAVGIEVLGVFNF